MIDADNRKIDGFTSLERGVDTGLTPNAILPTQVAMAINKTFRGGFCTTRPPMRKIKLDFAGVTDAETAFKTKNFQGGSYFDPLNDEELLVASVGGRVFRFKLNNYHANVLDISIPGDANFPNADMSWFVQAAQYLVMQNGINKPFIWDGSAARRALEDEVPVGQAMAVGMHRLWVSRGRGFRAGDIEGGPTSILKFTEDQYLAGGGEFLLPIEAGDITSMNFVAQMNTTAGQGELLVSTEKSVTSVLATYARSEWNDTDIQRIALINNGSMGHRSNSLVNGDMYYRAQDGIRTYIMAQRDFLNPGQTPISREMNKILSKDTDFLLKYCSSVLFDNRLLMTVSPKKLQNGCYHRGFLVLDFDLISSMGDKQKPAYEGIWTGIKPMQFVKGNFKRKERCFAFSYNEETQENELWEILKDGRDDFSDEEGNVKIIGSIETKSMNCGRQFDKKKLMFGELWADDIVGNTEFIFQYRPDQYPFWVDWHSFTECAPQNCNVTEGCQPVAMPYPQYRPRMSLPQPADDCDPVLGSLYRDGFEHQVRIITVGHCRFKQFRLQTEDIVENPFGECRESAPCENAATYIGCVDNFFDYNA